MNKKIEKDYTLNQSESKVLEFFLIKTSIRDDEIQIIQNEIVDDTGLNRLTVMTAIKNLKNKHILDKKQLWGRPEGNMYKLTLDFEIYLYELNKGNKDDEK